MKGLLTIITLMLCIWAHGGPVPLRELSRSAQTMRLAGDIKTAGIYRSGLSNVMAFVQKQTNWFTAANTNGVQLPRREDKEVIWQAWKTYMDYLLALDALDAAQTDWFKLSGDRRAQSFAVGYAAFLTKYRFGLELVTLMDQNPFSDKVLNEPVTEAGLPANTYAGLKFRILNVITATDFAARLAIFQTMRQGVPTELRAAIDADTAVILKMGHGKGELLTAKNALKILQSAGSTLWFPVQAGVSEWMGDTKVYRVGQSLISPTQIAALHKKLLPGDVLLTRREWFLSNIGLPGFWPHAALFIGTPEERRQYFSDAELVNWLQARSVTDGNFETWLRRGTGTNYEASLKPQEHRHPVRVIEAMSEGVSFTSLEHCADADALVVLRPLLPKSDKAIAIRRALYYAGRPYDFNFDFATDAELVCTELVYKAYEPSREMTGLHLPLEEMLGRQLLPANLIARQFDEDYGTIRAQFEFVAFLDGYEYKGAAVEADVNAFRKSWQRPKWHVLAQGEAK